jgi:hypothetical protein
MITSRCRGLRGGGSFVGDLRGALFLRRDDDLVPWPGTLSSVSGDGHISEDTGFKLKLLETMFHNVSNADDTRDITV